jgi:2-keto-4-pentenoate hydratase/2-oxohepta-3-ene-1,7-dioic acid hydratase in catechol pathway
MSAIIYIRWNQAGSQGQWGRVVGQRVRPLAQAPWLGERPLDGATDLPLAGLPLMAPCEPSKIVCVGVNYSDHAQEMGHGLPTEPLLFLKPPSALAHPGQAIRLPAASRRVDHEAELAFVVGRRVGPGMDPQGALFGYTCANDVTARDLQQKDGQWTRAKGFDTFCPAGPFLVAGAEVGDSTISCRVNGQQRQKSSTAQLIFKPQQILAAIAAVMTLEPGDLVLTGTPGGIGPLLPGDAVEVFVQGVGTLVNPVTR